MPMYRWNDLDDVFITPSHTPSKGKVILGKHLILQRILNVEDRGDGIPGATAHSHPEEQIVINLEKGKRMRVGSEWFTMEPGDVVLIPPYVDHEGTSDAGNLHYNIRSRVPGHSWYDGSWVSGAEADWGKVRALFLEMDKKYKEKLPWRK